MSGIETRWARPLCLAASWFLCVGGINACAGEAEPVRPDGRPPLGDIGVAREGLVPVGDGAPVDHDRGQSQADGPLVPPPEGAVHQSIVDWVRLPTYAGQYGVLFSDDEGKAKNQLGTLIAAVQTFIPDLQKNVNAAVNAGLLLLLFETFAWSLEDDPNVALQAHLGEDIDGDAENNFSGTEELNIADFSPKNAILSGTITDSKLAVGAGTMIVPLALTGPDAVFLYVVEGRVLADISPNGMTDGIIAGALPASEWEAKVVPLIVGLANESMSTMSTATKELFLSFVDTNDNGTIEAADLRSGVLGTALKPDVDTDGDGKKDALSLAVGFSAVPCIIHH